MINCIIIDDSPLALELLEDYISKVDYLKLVKRCTSAVEASEALKKGDIDLVFTDIQMPDITGIELLRSLKVKPKIIFTTAFQNYALEGFDLDATDFLLKPYSFDRFKKAVNKVFMQKEMEKKMEAEAKVIFVKSGYEVVKIPVNKIEYIEALKDYIQIFTDQQKVLTLMSMKQVLELLPSGQFARTHRSFIIPLTKITRVGTKIVRVGTKEIPIGDMYRESFLQLLKEHGQKF
jgi:DNA-binding LytR/AlgR family response regulator